MIASGDITDEKMRFARADRSSLAVSRRGIPLQYGMRVVYALLRYRPTASYAPTSESGALADACVLAIACYLQHSTLQGTGACASRKLELSYLSDRTFDFSQHQHSTSH